MAKAKRAGGLYRGPNGFKDARGQAVELAEVAEIDESLLTEKELAEVGGGVDATDSAIELAEEHGIDLAEVEGSGKDGRITKADVEAVVEAKKEKEED